jgi:diphthamide synthase (EF-2-diphthine--ammonia ligase)
LIFGDWHLQDIREWREQVFGEMGYRCLFPIWGKSLHDLLPVLLLKPVQIKISAVKEEFQQYIKVGETYDQAFVRTLPTEIDPMGENGEFHTEVMFEDLSKRVL